MAKDHKIDFAAMLSCLLHPQLSAPTSAPAQAPVAFTLNRVSEHLIYKNHLQKNAQGSDIPLYVYERHNEGYQHAPMFKASMLVDEVTYISPNTFSNVKSAKQDVAKIALECITKKIKDQ